MLWWHPITSSITVNNLAPTCLWSKQLVEIKSTCVEPQGRCWRKNFLVILINYAVKALMYSSRVVNMYRYIGNPGNSTQKIFALSLCYLYPGRCKRLILGLKGVLTEGFKLTSSNFSWNCQKWPYLQPSYILYALFQTIHMCLQQPQFGSF